MPVERLTPLHDAGYMSETPPIKCQMCATDIAAGLAVFLLQESLHEPPLVVCHDCGDLDLEVDP